MQSGRFDRRATIERKAIASDPEYVAPDPVYETEKPVWIPIDGYLPGSPPVAKKVWGERQDVLPSRSESVQQGLTVARNQVRWRMRWRPDIDSSMRITIHGATDEVFQIVAGPAEYGGRKQQIEMILEKTSA